MIQESPIVFVDVETTGLDDEQHGLIEFGCVIYDPAIGFLNGIETFVNPGRNVAVSPKALEVNGIREDMFRRQDVPDYITFSQMLTALGQRANTGSSKPIIGGWNVHFDYGFLRKAAGGTLRKSFDYHLVDVWALAHTLATMEVLDSSCFSSRGSLILENVARQFGVDVDAIEGDRHRAKFDAELTARCYVGLRDYLAAATNQVGQHVPSATLLEETNSPIE